MSEHRDVEARVLAELDRLGVRAEVMPCDPDFADTAAFCARYGVDPSDSANTIVVAARRPPETGCACVALATTRLDVNHRVCQLLGIRRASFASAEDTAAITGMLIGGVTPFALPAGLPVLIDSAVMARPSVVVGGGSRSMKLRVTPADLTRIPGARIVDGLAHAVAA